MPYTNHLEIIEAWPSLSAFAEDIGASYNTAKHIRRRQRIPPGYWPAVVKSAPSRDVKDVSADVLTQLYPVSGAPDLAEAS